MHESRVRAGLDRATVFSVAILCVTLCLCNKEAWGASNHAPLPIMRFPKSLLFHPSVPEATPAVSIQ
jgi:hypothetical protein